MSTGVVEVLRVGRVYGESKGITEVLAALEVLGSDLVGNLVRGVLHLLGETVRETELREDGVHLGLVVPGHTEDVDDMALGAEVVFFPAVHDGGGLHAGLAAHLEGLLLVDLDVIWHGPALHEHPCLRTHEVEDADVRAVGAFKDLHHLALAAFGTDFFLGKGYPDGVAVQGITCLRSLYEDVVLLSFDDYEGESLAAHLDLSDELGIVLEGLGAAATAAPPAGRGPGFAGGSAAAAAGTFPAVYFTRHISVFDIL